MARPADSGQRARPLPTRRSVTYSCRDDAVYTAEGLHVILLVVHPQDTTQVPILLLWAVAPEPTLVFFAVFAN